MAGPGHPCLWAPGKVNPNLGVKVLLGDADEGEGSLVDSKATTRGHLPQAPRILMHNAAPEVSRRPPVFKPRATAHWGGWQAALKVEKSDLSLQLIVTSPRTFAGTKRVRGQRWPHIAANRASGSRGGADPPSSTHACPPIVHALCFQSGSRRSVTLAEDPPDCLPGRRRKPRHACPPKPPDQSADRAEARASGTDAGREPCAEGGGGVLERERRACALSPPAAPTALLLRRGALVCGPGVCAEQGRGRSRPPIRPEIPRFSRLSARWTPKSPFLPAARSQDKGTDRPPVHLLCGRKRSASHC
jgi:hypothetical protein